MKILDEWKKDMPQQFQGHHNIDVLLNAFAKQLEEIRKVYEDMQTKLDLDKAVGQNLDYVGSIISLSRKEAGTLAGLSINDPVLSDESYRNYLRYQNLVNTNECTYYDLMEGLGLLWDISPVYYKEMPEYPATIILDIPFTKPGGETVTLGEVPMVKPAGVQIQFQYMMKSKIEVGSSMTINSTYDIPRCNQYLCGQYPPKTS